MKNNKIAWFFFAILFIVIAFLLGYLLTLTASMPKQNPSSFSAENSKPDGTKALYRFYQVRGYQVKLWKQNYRKLPSTSGDLLMIIGPQAKAPNEQEIKALYDWVRRGNKVVLWSPMESEWTKRFQFEGMSCLKKYKRQVYSSEKSKWFQRTKIINWPTGQCVLPASDHQDVLVDEENYSLMIKKMLGKGEIYYTPETEILINQQIDQEDHMQFSLAIADKASGTIWFDESVHPGPQSHNQAGNNGFSNKSETSIHKKDPPSIFAYLNLDVWLVLIQILLCVLLYLYLKGKRFAAPRREWKKEKRNSLEYVEAMARWYQRSNMRKEVYDHFRLRLEKELMEALQIPKHQFSQVGFEKINHFLGKDYQMRYKKWATPVALEKGSKRLSLSLFLQATLEVLRLRKELQEWKNRRNKQVVS